jgi:hypothetical protein
MIALRVSMLPSAKVHLKKYISLKDIASRMVNSLYIPKVAQVRSHYEGVLVVRKDGYTKY